MIFIGIGSNLSSSLGGPRATCEAALALLEAEGIAVLRCSSWYESAPVPASDQPWFVNGVADVATNRSAQDLLACLLSIETKLGRERTTPNAARSIDLDLLAFGDVVTEQGLHLPHPRLHERAFVLLPLQEIAPHWRHPVSGGSVEDLITNLPPGQDIRRIESNC